mgnify:FL=1
MNIITNKNNFEETILKSKTPVLVDFYADWCTPCKMMSPIIEEVSNEFKDKIIVLKINIDECPDIAQKYSVMSIPTIILFKNGEATKTSVGVTSKEKLVEMIQA